MFDHVGLRVSDYARSRHFYETVLAPLGITLRRELTPAQTGGASHCGFGDGGPGLCAAATAGHPRTGHGKPHADASEGTGEDAKIIRDTA